MRHSVAIIGAGWSGLACAVKLSLDKFQVQLYDSSPIPGGRARQVSFGIDTIDNGQHICMGASHALKYHLETIGQDFMTLFKIELFSLSMYSSQYPLINMQYKNLPAPWNALFGITLSKGLSLKNKYYLIRLFYQLKQMPTHLIAHKTLARWCNEQHCPLELYKRVIEPIALAAMTTHAENSSLIVFQKLIKNCFFGKQEDSYILFPKKDLGNILPNPTINYLKQHGHDVFLHQRIHAFESNRCKVKLMYTKNKTIQADVFVLATPPWQSYKLLRLHPQCLDLCTQLSQFHCEDIITIYYKFSKAINLPQSMIGLNHQTAQWLFDRKFCNQANILSAVISSPIQKFNSHTDLAYTVWEEIKSLHNWPTNPYDFKVIHEKKAAFNCNPQIQKLRPTNATPYRNLYLAGDYTQTYYPSTLEGAIKSGQNAADMIIANFD